MEQKTTPPPSSSSQMWERLETFVREQIPRFIQALLEEEATTLLGRPKSARRAAVDASTGLRNGYGKPRRLTLTAGTITVRRPRVRGLDERFVSRVLPLFKRRTREGGELLPRLYLQGLALGDFDLALRGLLGEAAPLSPTSLTRLKAQWQLEYEAWKRRRLDALAVVYVWADGFYVKAGLDDSKAALLVLIGVLTNGQKVVLTVESGQRESKESWGAVLRDLRARGLQPWRCTIADGHLGIWAALGEQQPTAAEQRCWNHRIVNVLEPCRPSIKRRLARCYVPCPMRRAKRRARSCGRNLPSVIARWRQRLSSVSRLIGSGWSPSTSSRGNIGVTYGRRMWSSPPLQPCGCARQRPNGSRRSTPPPR